MRLSVTPIGSARLSAGQIASAVVEYLAGVEEQAPSLTGPDPATPPAPDPAAGYYADSVEGPGVWLGRGAAQLGLAGAVDRNAFARVLEGRHPATGERLLSARGSADRDHLAVGKPTRRAEDGEWLYDVRDAAKALGLAVQQVEEYIAIGDRPDDSGAPALRSECDDSGDRWIRDAELERFAAELAALSAEALRASGEPSEMLGTKEAASLLGVSPRYVRECCRYWETHRSHIDALVAAGLRPGRAWLVASRAGDDGNGAYEITRAEVAAFADRRVAPVVRVGYDLTLSTEKSVAVAALLDPTGRSGDVLAAIDAANDAALSFLDRHASYGRRRGARTASEGLVVASFLHGTSRALDPFPHRHNVVANTVEDETGERRALDARALFRHAPTAAALATAELRWRLSRDLGVRWRRSPRGTWEIDGIPDSTIREFSRRRDEIDAALAELSEALGRTLEPSEVDTVVLATRAAKARVAVEDLRAGWWERAERSGLSPRALASCFGHGAECVERLTDDQEERLHTWLGERLVDEGAVFAHGDVVRAIGDWTDGADTLVVLAPAELLRQAARFLASHQVVELAGGGRVRHPLRRRDGRTVDMSGGDPAFTTVALLELERDVFDAFDAGLVDAAAVPPAVVARAPGFDGLSESQQHFAVSLCASGMSIQCAIGHPGSGKTHTLGVAARAWESAGKRVVGAAVKGEAARVLAEATKLRETETVAWWLTALDHRRTRWDGDTVILVDEASTLSTRDLAALVSHARVAGATLRLVGDPHQHGAVGAGGLFTALTGRHTMVPELAENRRQVTEVDRHAAAAVRAGHVGEALAALKLAGQLTEVDRAEGVYAAMVTRWLTSRHAGEPHPMIDRRNGTRRVLNALAHRVLQSEGAVAATGLVTAEGLEFCVGDDVIARRPDRTLHPAAAPDRYVRNGSRGRVVAVNTRDEGLTVAFDDLDEIELPLSFIECGPSDNRRRDIGLDYGYALTSYAVQGATLPVSSSAITAGGRRRELYVNITRGRRDNHLFVAAPADPAGGEGHLPRPPEHDVVAEVLAAVGRPDEQRCATAIDLGALAAARARQGKTLGELDALVAAIDDPVLAHAVSLEEAAISRLAVAETPASIAELLPPRRDVPWLQARWDAAAGAMALRVARAPAASLPDYVWTDPAVIDVWVQHTWRLVTERLHSSGRPAAFVREAWFVAELETLAASGRLGQVDPAAIAELGSDTASYRQRYLPADGHSAGALGPMPRERVAKRDHAVLAHRWQLLHQGRGRAAGRET